MRCRKTTVEKYPERSLNHMTNVRLGKTEITVNKNGFGALPIQRIPKAEAVYAFMILPVCIQTARKN